MKSPEIQRLIDLLATLLARRYPATLEDLSDPPAATTAGSAVPHSTA